MKTESGEFLIVGSNNLTGAAISSNHELATLWSAASIPTRPARDFLAYFDSLKEHRACFVPGAQRSTQNTVRRRSRANCALGWRVRNSLFRNEKSALVVLVITAMQGVLVNFSTFSLKSFPSLIRTRKEGSRLIR